MLPSVVLEACRWLIMSERRAAGLKWNVHCNHITMLFQVSHRLSCVRSFDSVHCTVHPDYSGVPRPQTERYESHQGRPLGGATGALAPGPAPRDERNRTPPPPPPPPRNAIANGPRGAPLHTSHRAPRQPGTALNHIYIF